MPKPLCLVVDDEPDLRELSVITLNDMGVECRTAENLTEAKIHLQVEPFEICLTDMRLPDGDGIELVTYITHTYPNTPVAMITAYGNIESAVQALKAGAFDFIAKPVKIDELRKLVNTALQLSTQGRANFNLREDIASRLIGESNIMQTLRATIDKLARSQAPIYIRGESGTGKEVVARILHALGPRAAGPFIPVNCGAIPSELMESELFGYKKGSFTGAQADKPGLFQAASGGTLFLDEVADLPIAMQVKLLRAIQEKQVRPVGASREVAVDVRILSATHHNLSELVKQGKFRHDLFYRLNVIEIYVPPLRERPEDIPLLVNKILDNLTDKMALDSSDYPRPTVSPAALTALQEYSFPGNVRELENILERAMTLCEHNTIDKDDLHLSSGILGKKEDLQLSAGVFMSSSQLKEGTTTTTLDPLIDGVERETILNALEHARGNKTKAAKLLGISFGALRYRLQKFKIELK